MVNVHVGEDGTNDRVTIEICSDMDSDCCTKMLDSFFNDFTSMFERVLLYEISHSQGWGLNTQSVKNFTLFLFFFYFDGFP